jgi:flagellar biosynthesis/type III secretory pathway chaperone
MTPKSFDALIELLGQEDAIYRELADLLDEEQAAMIAMAADRLGEIVARKETLALRVKALDESRKVLARRLGEALGLASNELTVTLLCRRAEPETGRRLAEAAGRLRASLERCQRLNDANGRAARRGMELVGGAIQYLIEQANPGGRVYQPPRKAAPPATGRGGFISQRA